MKVQEFVKTYETQFTDYCSCIITKDGEVRECVSGHTETLQELFKEEYPGEEMPKNVMPMQYLIVKTGAVAVDYENQVYNEVLTDEQKEALNVLADEGMIDLHLGDIHGKYE